MTLRYGRMVMCMRANKELRVVGKGHMDFKRQMVGVPRYFTVSTVSLLGSQI